ncbi:MAG: hypothetical protein INF41_00685 [Rhodospirillaceae bacterium]|jgi:hypothetical protein|nr:hypothetical protein [Rhodospirillaceae bacterium]
MTTSSKNDPHYSADEHAPNPKGAEKSGADSGGDSGRDAGGGFAGGGFAGANAARWWEELAAIGQGLGQGGLKMAAAAQEQMRSFVHSTVEATLAKLNLVQQDQMSALEDRLAAVEARLLAVESAAPVPKTTAAKPKKASKTADTPSAHEEKP